MTAVPSVSCAAFDDAVDELAAGIVSEPRRSALLAHAAVCPICGARLRELADVADRLLLLVAPAEPPVGFESRVLDRIDSLRERRNRRRPRAWTAVAAVAALAAAIVVGVAVGRATTEAGPRRAAVVSAAGTAVGEVELVREPRPHVLVTIDHPRPDPGGRSCELVLADGRRVVVGRWTYDEVERGAWAVGVDADLLTAVSMRIVDDDGIVVASARFQ